MGVAYNQTVTASGGTAPYTFAVTAGALPTSLSLASGGGLTGTPSAAGTFNFTIQATDANTWAGTRAYAITVSTVALDLSVPTVYITQSTQTPAFNVPLVANRDGYLRAFAIAAQSNSATPQVRVRIYNASDVLVQTYTLNAPGASTPTSVNEATLTSSWNQLIPGSLLQPGYSLLVDVDPSALLSESNEGNNTWPVSGTPHDLDVRDLPALEMTLVPVTTGAGTGNVTGGNAASFMDYTRRVQPIPDYTVQVRAAMNSAAAPASNGDGWITVLNEVTAQRTADGSSRHYYGVLKVAYGSGVAGLGWIGYPVAIGWDYLPSGSWTMAHEIGHNWNYGHTACTGGESGPDPGYPYGGGIIGAYGYDLWTSTQKDKTTTKDLMSYCSPQWISDYTYKKILTYRVSIPTALRGLMEIRAAEEPCLLIWGTEKNGAIALEPGFLISTRPQAPIPGPYRAQGLDDSGRVLWSQDFGLMETSHPTDPAAGFCFAVPMSAELLDRTSALRVVRGGQEIVRRVAAKPSATRSFRQTPAVMSMTRAGANGVDFNWDASSAPVVMVRDLDRDEVIGFARGGAMRLSTTSRRLELLFSDGVHTRTQQWTAP